MNNYRFALISLLFGFLTAGFAVVMIRHGLYRLGTLRLIGALGFFVAAFGEYRSSEFLLDFGLAILVGSFLLTIIFRKAILRRDTGQQ